MTFSRLFCYSLTREKCAFQFLCSRCDRFSKILHFLHLDSLEPPSTRNLFFLQNPINFKFIFAKSLQGMHFWYPLLSFYWDYVDFSLGFCKLGIFWKWVGVFIFMQISFKILIRLCFIWCLCICVGPLRHFEHVLSKISLCSCILHHLCSLLHVRCLTKCPSDIFVLNWT